MFAMALYEISKSVGDEKGDPTLKVIALKHISLYKDSGLAFPVFESMYDELSPSYLDDAKVSGLVSEISHLMREFSGDEAIRAELMEVRQIAHDCASGAGRLRIEFTPYGEHSYRNQLQSA